MVAHHPNTREAEAGGPVQANLPTELIPGQPATQ